jgi:uncharacterized membrane protein YedE/YeeE
MYSFLLIIGLFLILLLTILITQYVWNVTMPEIFGVKEITFWQTVGLMILSNIFLTRPVINNK